MKPLTDRDLTMKKKIIIKEQKGVAIVEFAIILPVLLFLLFFIIEGGVILYDQAMLTNAAREGARAGIIYDDPRICNGDAASGIKGVVYGYIENTLINLNKSLITDPTIVRKDRSGTILADCEGEAGGELTVTASYQYDFLIMPNLVELLGGSHSNILTLTAVSRMRFE